MIPSQIFSGLAVTLCLQIDLILIGIFVGVDGIAAYGLANPVHLFFTAVTGLFSMGIATVCSQLVGKGDVKGVNGNFSSAVFSSLLFSGLFILVMFLGSDSLITLLGAEKGTALFTMTKEYLDGYLIGVPAYFLMTVVTAYLQIAGKRRGVMLSSLVMTGLDVILDLFVGLVWKNGMFGMGLATAISEIAGCLVAILCLFGKNRMFRFRFPSVSFRQILGILTQGLPIAINQICFTVSLLVLNRLLLVYGGSNGVAVYSVLSSISSLCFCASQGVGTTVQMLTGIFFGEKDRNNVYETLKQGFIWAFLLNTVIAAVIILLARPVAGLFVSDNAEVTNLTVHAIRLNMFNIVPMSICVVFKNYYPCIRKLTLSILTGVLENLVLIVPVNYLMGALFGLDGLWIAKTVGELLTLVFIAIVSMIKSRRAGLEVKILSLIEEDFVLSDDQIACFDIRNLEDAAAASENAGKFCRNLGCPSGRANYISLCIEEMAADIIGRSFEPNRNNLIQVRLVRQEDGWTIRMRDNCRNFDIVHYMELYKEDDSISHLGVRMVSKMITEAKYINSLGFNCLTMNLSEP